MLWHLRFGIYDSAFMTRNSESEFMPRHLRLGTTCCSTLSFGISIHGCEGIETGSSQSCKVVKLQRCKLAMCKHSCGYASTHVDMQALMWICKNCMGNKPLADVTHDRLSVHGIVDKILYMDIELNTLMLTDVRVFGHHDIQNITRSHQVDHGCGRCVSYVSIICVVSYASWAVRTICIVSYVTTYNP